MVRIKTYIMIWLISLTISCALQSLAPAQEMALFNQKVKRLAIQSFALPAPQTITRYSLTQAYRTIDYLNNLLEKWYGGAPSEVRPWSPYDTPGYAGSLEKYKNIITAAMAREEQYKQTHYVFYHAFYSSVRIIQDLQTQLCFKTKKCPITNTFVKLRDFDASFATLGSLQKWMDDKAHYIPIKFPAFNDRTDIQPYVLAVNFSLFANLARWNSNTWQYFVYDRSANPPRLDVIIPTILRSYVKDPVLINSFSYRIQNLRDYLTGGGLMQLFIAKDRVDDLVYISKSQGYYWDRNIADLAYPKKLPHAVNKAWSKIKQRYTHIHPLLSLYANKPKSLNIIFSDTEPGKLVPGVDNIVIDRIEGRIFLKSEYFALPHKDIAMYRYFTLTPAQEAHYQEALGTIIQEIVDRM